MGTGAPAAPPRSPGPRSFDPRRGARSSEWMNRRHKQPWPPPPAGSYRRSPPPQAGRHRRSSPQPTGTSSCWQRLHRNSPRLVQKNLTFLTFRIHRNRPTNMLLLMFRTKQLHLHLQLVTTTTTRRRRTRMSTSMTSSTLASSWMMSTCLMWRMKKPSTTTAMDLLAPLHATSAWTSPTRLRMPAIMMKLNRVKFSALTLYTNQFKQGSLLHPQNPQRRRRTRSRGRDQKHPQGSQILRFRVLKA